MAAPSCVVLYGNSVFLAGIRADLKRRAELEVLTVEPDSPDTAGRIHTLNPTAVLFDLAAAQPDFAIPLLRDWPGMILIGVNSSSDVPVNALFNSSRMTTAIASLVAGFSALVRMPHHDCQPYPYSAFLMPSPRASFWAV